MVQPKKPPVSIRISDELIASVAGWAKKRKITRNAAYAQLLEAGLKANGPSLSKPERQAAPELATFNGSPGLVNAPPSMAAIPYAGDMQRKPYQKGSKK